MTSSSKTHTHHDISRRRLLEGMGGLGLGSALLPAGGLLSQVAQAQEAGLEITDLNATTSLVTGAGSNVLVKKAGNGELLIVDGGLQQHARDLRRLIRQHTGSRRVHTLFNTHWHREQTGLNELLAGDTRIFAHENTRLWLQSEVRRPWEDQVFAPLPGKALPDETYYHYGEFTVDDTPVWYGYMLQAHTDGDTYIYLPEDNVLHAGGVLSNGSWPLMDWWTGGWIGGLADGLETLLRVGNEDTVFIPANGAVMSYAEVQAQSDMYNDIFSKVRALFMQARGPQETVDAKPAGDYEALMGNSDQFILLAHQSVLPHLSPDA